MRAAPDVWGVADICDALGVTRLTVQRWREGPNFPPAALVNRGKTAVWEPAAVLQWAVQNAGVPHARDAAHQELKRRGGAG